MRILKNAMDISLKGINTSLLPLIFPKLDSQKIPSKSNFVRDILPNTVAIICRFSAIIIQMYWIILKSKGIYNKDPFKSEVCKKLDDILVQLWSGNQKYTDNFAISILQEVSILPKSTIIGDLVNRPEIFVKWGQLINYRKAPLKRYLSELDKENIAGIYQGLIESLNVLRRIEHKDEYFIFQDFDNIEFPIFPFFLLNEVGGKPMFLYSIEYDKQNCGIIFEDPCHGYTDIFDLNSNESYKERCDLILNTIGLDSINDVYEGIFYLFGSGYKHIQEIAHALESRTPVPIKQKLFERYKKEYPEINPHLYEIDFFTLLLADLGPTKLVREILDNNENFLFDYLDHFEKRGLGKKNDWIAELDIQMKKKEKSIANYLIFDSNFKSKMLDRIEKESKAWILIKAAGSYDSAPPSYVESIDLRLEMIRKWSKGFEMCRDYDKAVNTIIKINKLIERTLKFLIAFYSGMETYQKKMAIDEGMGEDKNFKKYENSMIKTAKDKLKGIEKKSAGVLITYFKEKIIKDKNILMATENLIGRKEVCNLEKYNNLTKGEWLKWINWSKHDLKDTEFWKDEIETFNEQTIKLFEFLQKGLNEKKNYAPIYPLIISFREVHRNRDGMHVYGYEIYSIEDKSDINIRILTENEYFQNEKYYCIPHYNRSTKDWWLDPFLIRCRKFDDIFETKKDFIKPLLK